MAVQSVTEGGVPFQELGGSPTLRINTDGISATRKFWVNQTANLTAFLSEVVGIWVLVGNNNQQNQQGQCVFQSPMPYPGFSNLVPDDIYVAPHQPDSPAGTFPVDLSNTVNDYLNGWDVTVQYKTMYNLGQQRDGMPGVANGTYLTYEEDTGAEYLTIPGRTWRWMISPGLPLLSETLGEDNNPGVLIPTRNYTLTWERVLSPPWTTIASTVGKVNNATFMDAPAGCTLFLGDQITRQFQFTDDAGFWRVQYKFSEQNKTLTSGTRVGWNYFYRAQALAGEHWCQIGTEDTSEPPYQSADFTALFDMPISC